MTDAAHGGVTRLLFPRGDLKKNGLHTDHRKYSFEVPLFCWLVQELVLSIHRDESALLSFIWSKPSEQGYSNPWSLQVKRILWCLWNCDISLFGRQLNAVRGPDSSSLSLDVIPSLVLISKDCTVYSSRTLTVLKLWKSSCEQVSLLRLFIRLLPVSGGQCEIVLTHQMA